MYSFKERFLSGSCLEEYTSFRQWKVRILRVWFQVDHILAVCKLQIPEDNLHTD